MDSKKIGFWSGILLFFVILIFFNPDDLSQRGQITAAVFILMGIWWATEALPLPATALIPIIAFPLLGVEEIGVLSKEYMNKVQFLFAGGFMIAIAMQKWNLHKRIALIVLSITGFRSERLIAGFMIASFVLSMWIMNTSTTIMLLPIGISIIQAINDSIKNLSEDQKLNFQVCLLLGIAYASSLGGITTPIGTAPNGVLIQYAFENYNLDIGFIDWFSIAAPFSILSLPIIWLVLTKFLFPINFSDTGSAEKILFEIKEELGVMSREEKIVSLVFLFTALGWVFRKIIDDLPFFFLLEDAVISMMGGLSLFFLTSNQKRLLDWEDIQNKFPWGLIFLFGGGMTLAYVVNDSGLAIWLANLVPNEASLILVLFIVIAMVIVLTELTSNLTTTITFIPIIAGVGINIGVNPMLLIVPLTIAASCAFMLPVATPPNSIVYASGYIPINRMVRAGIFLNIICGLLLLALNYLFPNSFQLFV
jgi:sodium-dependent dicarboxylate transporter 2/3/5